MEIITRIFVDDKPVGKVKSEKGATIRCSIQIGGADAKITFVADGRNVRISTGAKRAVRYDPGSNAFTDMWR